MSDPRQTPFNGRVAHESLRGTVTAERFTEGVRKRVALPVAGLHRDGPALERQLLLGEPFRVLDEAEEQSFGIAELSGYVGHLATAALGPWEEPTHVVVPRATFGFATASIKAPAPVPLSLGSRLRVVARHERFLQSAEGWFLPAAHLAPLEAPEDDPVAVAERLLGTPYLWGGNSAFGIDCSGLVQAGLRACGRPCPGDSDLQMQALGRPLPEGATAQRGDLLFWKGHVAWVADPETLVHANAHHMAVAYEPLRAAVARIAAQGDGPVLAHKRLEH